MNLRTSYLPPAAPFNRVPNGPRSTVVVHQTMSNVADSKARGDAHAVKRWELFENDETGNIFEIPWKISV